MSKPTEEQQPDKPATAPDPSVPSIKKGGVVSNDIKKKPLPQSRPPNQAPRPVDRTKNKSGRK